MSDLETKVEEIREVKRRLFFWYLPYDTLLAWLVMRYDKKNPAWDADHFDGWSKDDLVWRVCFLQGAGRGLWVERELWRTYLVPVLFFVGMVSGYVLARW